MSENQTFWICFVVCIAIIALTACSHDSLAVKKARRVMDQIEKGYEQ